MEAVTIARFHSVSICYDKDNNSLRKASLVLSCNLLTYYFQTELAGRQPHNWATVEASHEKHNLHQLCRSEHSCGRRRLGSATHVLGILGIFLHLPSILWGSLCILVFLCTASDFFRWGGTEQCSWYQKRCRADILGQPRPSRGWWRREASLKTSPMDWEVSTTGEKINALIQWRYNSFQKDQSCSYHTYRDDGFRLWDALHRYVEGVVQIAYPSEQVD